MKIINYEPIRNGTSTLQGKFMVEVSPGMVITDFTYYERSNGERWCSFPARQFLKENGKKGYQDIIRFNDQDQKVTFKEWLLSQVDELRP
jgi:hypothetical protein